MATKFIAEICSNHNGDLERAVKLIQAAADVGCWGVKFQLFRVDKLFASELLAHKDYAFVNKRREWEMPLEWLPTLKEACDRFGLKFGCTPFYLEAVDQLESFVDFYKVASYELLWSDLLDRIMKTGKPVMMSTGMATFDEIKQAVWRQQKIGNEPHKRLILLHCISQYPTKIDDCHLEFISKLRVELNSIAGVGWSDHSVSPAVIYRAVHRYGAEVIEFHLDLYDRLGVEYSQGHCWVPFQIYQVIKTIREGFLASGNLDKYNPADNPEREFRADPSDGLRPIVSKRGNL